MRSELNPRIPGYQPDISWISSGYIDVLGFGIKRQLQKQASTTKSGTRQAF